MEAYSVLRDPRSRAEYDTRYDSQTAVHGRAGDPREVPVRRVSRQQPHLLRVSPVRWEPR
jgi:DnaJ-class molecular chaperone